MVDQPEAGSVAAEDDAERRAFLEELRASGVLDRFYEDFRKRRRFGGDESVREPAKGQFESPASVAGIERRLSAVEARVGHVETRLAVVETKTEMLVSQISKLEVRLASVEVKLGLLTDRVGQSETKLAAVEARPAAVEAHLSVLDASIKELRDQARTDFRLLFGALIAAAPRSRRVDGERVPLVLRPLRSLPSSHGREVMVHRARSRGIARE